MELLALVKKDFMKFQDSTVKDALMDRSGMVLNALGIPLAQADTYGTINITDVMLRPFNAHKTLNGTEPSVFAIQTSIWLAMYALDAHQTLLGTEGHAMHKFQSTNARATKFLSTVNVFVKMDSSILADHAFNAHQEQHGTETIVITHQPQTGVWVSPTHKLPTEAAHAWFHTLSSMVVVNNQDEDRLILQIHSFIFENLYFLNFIFLLG